MKDWKQTFVHPGTPILEAMRIIDATGTQIALVIDPDSRLLGVVTDGDIRRSLLRGLSLEQAAESIMNREFTAVSLQTTREEVLKLMQLKGLRQIPVLDSQGRVLGLKFLEDLIQPEPRDNWVVIMAGGLGTRLRPFTQDCPKPMLRVGNKPVIETILESFIEYGFRKYFISINYKGEMIEGIIRDGARWGVAIDYLREDKRLGTAGSLDLLPEHPELPLIVMNGDVLTKVNFQQLLDFHREHRAMASMCVREYHFQVPYGVVKTDHQRLLGIDEKPLQRFFINAGIYVLEPEVLDLVPRGSYLDMPHLFEQALERGYEAVVFPLREYWIDIGQVSDFERANGEYGKIFP